MDQFQYYYDDQNQTSLSENSLIGVNDQNAWGTFHYSFQTFDSYATNFKRVNANQNGLISQNSLGQYHSNFQPLDSYGYNNYSSCFIDQSGWNQQNFFPQNFEWKQQDNQSMISYQIPTLQENYSQSLNQTDNTINFNDFENISSSSFSQSKKIGFWKEVNLISKYKKYFKDCLNADQIIKELDKLTERVSGKVNRLWTKCWTNDDFINFLKIENNSLLKPYPQLFICPGVTPLFIGLAVEVYTRFEEIVKLTNFKEYINNFERSFIDLMNYLTGEVLHQSIFSFVLKKKKSRNNKKSILKCYLFKSLVFTSYYNKPPHLENNLIKRRKLITNIIETEWGSVEKFLLDHYEKKKKVKERKYCNS